jgi:Spy/CpxP family protein refolding chaperone
MYYKVVRRAMNLKTLFVAIAIVATFGIGAVSGLATIIPVQAQENMTMGGNMTGGNMTGGNMTMGDNMTMGG